jgi:hypothetical protein
MEINPESASASATLSAVSGRKIALIIFMDVFLFFFEFWPAKHCCNPVPIRLACATRSEHSLSAKLSGTRL